MRIEFETKRNDEFGTRYDVNIDEMVMGCMSYNYMVKINNRVFLLQKSFLRY
jgi:hypothetical protein